MADGTGLKFNTGLSTANGGTELLQLDAILEGTEQQSVTVQPAQLLQVTWMQAPAQQQWHAPQVAANQAVLAK